MSLKVAINGFGRIGRQFYRIASGDPDLEIVVINDLGEAENLLYLLKHDSVYGAFGDQARLDSGYLTYQSNKSCLLSQKDPNELPWADLGVDVVIESTGFFTDRKGATQHLQAGAKKVLISAPAKEPDLTIVLGVNEKQYDSTQHHIIANASCTTNCAALVAKVLHDAFGIKKAWLTTVHAYTSTQSLVDAPDVKDVRRGRAAAANIVPTTTGAAKAVIEVIPELKGKMDGVALRVPVICGSIIDLVAEVGQDVSAEQVNQALAQAAFGKMEGILLVSSGGLVSSDVIKTTHSAIVDAPFTRVLGGNLVKVLAWYDNEWAYSQRLVDVCKLVGGTWT